jgi:hypothetical protein
MENCPSPLEWRHVLRRNTSQRLRKTRSVAEKKVRVEKNGNKKMIDSYFLGLALRLASRAARRRFCSSSALREAAVILTAGPRDLVAGESSSESFSTSVGSPPDDESSVSS